MSKPTPPPRPKASPDKTTRPPKHPLVGQPMQRPAANRLPKVTRSTLARVDKVIAWWSKQGK